MTALFEETKEGQILKHFKGRPDIHARWVNGKPRPIRKPITDNDMSLHLAGKACCGFYLLSKDNTVWCACFDVDDHENNPNAKAKDDAELLELGLGDLGLSPLVETSQSGRGYHIWLFFDESLEAWFIRAFFTAVSKHVDCSAEIYPKQDKLSPEGLGNMVRYPFWGESTCDLDAIESVDKATLVDVAESQGWELSPEADLTPLVCVVSDDLPERIALAVSNEKSLVGARWRGETAGLEDASKSGVLMSLMTEFKDQQFTDAEVIAAAKIWAEKEGKPQFTEERWLNNALTQAYRYLGKRIDTGGLRLDLACESYLDALEQDQFTPIPTGIKDVDTAIEGVMAEEYCVIGGQTSQGKTALGLQWTLNAANEGYKTAIISEEMGARALSRRVLGRITAMEQEIWRDNTTSLRRQSRGYFEAIHKPVLLINLKTIENVKKQVKKHAAEGVSFFLVDYIQLINLGSDASEYYTITTVSNELATLARDLGVSIVALSQLSRSIEGRRDKDGIAVPCIEDLRGSGAIGQDADTVMFGVYPHHMNASKPKTGYEVHFKKRRNGPIRKPVAHITFNPERQLFL